MDINKRTEKHLKGFFDDKNKINKLLLDPILINAASFIDRYESDGDLNFRKDISEVINIYKNIYDMIGNEIRLILINQDKDLVNENNIWHRKQEKLQALHRSSDNYDTFETAVDLIGDIIEGMIKYHFREIYQLMYYSSEKKFLAEDKFLKIKLGTLNDCLLNKCKKHLTHLFMTSLPVQYKFSNWRNLAQHKNYIIDKDSISLSFESGGTVTEYSLTREDILKYYTEITRAANVFLLARVIFITDLPKEVSDSVIEYSKKVSDSLPAIKQELMIKDLETVLLSQGLEIESFDDEKDTVVVFIKEKEAGENSIPRINFLTCTLYKVWEIFRKKTVKIQYMDFHSNPYYLLRVDEEICNQIERTGNLYLISGKFDLIFY